MDVAFPRFRLSRTRACVVLVTVGLLIVVATGRPAWSADDAKEADQGTEVPRKAVVHAYPHKLTPRDKLTDGPNGRVIEITAETTLIWVDLHPDARYAHDTQYVLISPRGTRVVDGQWWPVLNGKPVLRGERPADVRFPVELAESPASK